MNILFVAHRLPYPPDKGEKIRAWHWIRALAPHYAVHVVAPYDDPADAAHINDVCDRGVASLHTVYVSPKCGKRIAAWRSLWTGRPIGVEFCAHRGLAAAAARLRNELNPVAEIVFSTAADVILPPVHPHIPRILDLVDVDSAKYESYAADERNPLLRMVYAREARKLRAYEAAAAARASLCLLVSEPEAELFRQRSGARNVLAMPHGTDLDTIAEPVRPPPGMVAMSAVFVGNMDYRPNVEAVTRFCAEVLPRVRAQVPDFHFYVVGRNPTEDVRRLHDGCTVTVTGAVPDVRGYVQHAAVSVAPMHTARGVQNKILEAMAAGRPVLTTSLGAEGLETVHDTLSIADTPEHFADTLVHLLRDSDARTTQGLRARAAVRARYDADRAGAAFTDAVLRTITR